MDGCAVRCGSKLPAVSCPLSIRNCNPGKWNRLRYPNVVISHPVRNNKKRLMANWVKQKTHTHTHTQTHTHTCRLGVFIYCHDYFVWLLPLSVDLSLLSLTFWTGGCVSGHRVSNLFAFHYSNNWSCFRNALTRCLRLGSRHLHRLGPLLTRRRKWTIPAVFMNRNRLLRRLRPLYSACSDPINSMQCKSTAPTRIRPTMDSVRHESKFMTVDLDLIVRVSLLDWIHLKISIN